MTDDAEPYSSTERPDPRVGAVLGGKYRVDRRIGRGGMGTVYEATNLAIKKRVAIKFLHPEIAHDAGAVARFRGEAIAATSLEHPHIVAVLDMDRADGSVYLVLEYLEGRAWARELEAEPRPPVARVVHIVRQIADALAAAHANGIVHRDLKPENVMLVRRGDDPDFVKVLDFGVAKMAGVTGAPSTRTGAAVGTAYYMAPEQLRDSSSVDARADVWAIGVMLHRALSGRLPFGGATLPEIALKIVSEEPPPLEGVPPAIAELTARLLQKDPSARPAHAGEVLALLRAFDGLDVALAQTLPRAALAPARVKRSPIGAVALGILAIALVAAIGWAALGTEPSPPAPRAREARAPAPAIAEPVEEPAEEVVALPPAIESEASAPIARPPRRHPRPEPPPEPRVEPPPPPVPTAEPPSRREPPTIAPLQPLETL